MLTVLEAINLSTDFLDKKGIESPRINAELLLANILKCKRLNLYLNFDRPLQENELQEFRESLRRRGKSEPLQYIVGEVEFYGLSLKVNSSVLIPRQETEIVVEAIINYCKKNQITKILDVGTGSGNIAIALAKNLEEAEITAIDNSLDALETAKINAIDNAVDSKIRFRLINVTDTENQLNKEFELVVSNPPYISREEFETLQPELRVYEPSSALTDNNDGLSFFRLITSESAKWLKPRGALFFEVGAGQADKVKEIMAERLFTNITSGKDYLGIDRVISGELS